MPVNKNALLRYQVLDRCFGNPGRSYFIEDLMEECREAMEDHTGKPARISRRQLFEDIKFMESEAGYRVLLMREPVGKRISYRYEERGYSINNQPLNAVEESQLKQALLVLERFKGLPQFQWLDELSTRLVSGLGLKQGAAQVMSFQENPYLQGAEHLSPLLDAILDHRLLEVDYQGFKQAEPQRFLFHAHLLKQYNNRWFVFGYQDERSTISNLALDRIQAIVPAPQAVYRTSDTDWEDYFEDVVGVTVPDTPVETVTIRIGLESWPYVQTKPLHGSMRTGERTKDYQEVTLDVKVNHELKANLLAYGKGLTVVGPATLQAQLHQEVDEMSKRYGSHSRGNMTAKDDRT